MLIRTFRGCKRSLEDGTLVPAWFKAAEWLFAGMWFEICAVLFSHPRVLGSF